MSDNTDPRVREVAWVINYHRLEGLDLERAEKALEAADSVDREAGYFRVRMDDEMVEQVARVLSQTERQMYTNESLGKQRMQARAVLSALRGEIS